MVIIQADTKAQLERKGAQAVTALEGWCQRNKLRLAAHKSELMLLKGKLNIRSPPVIRIDGETIKSPESLTYLGLSMTPGLKFGVNATAIKNRVPSRIAAIRSLSGASWGASYKTRQVYYTALCESVMLYAAPAWIRELRAADWAVLERAQRTALLAVTQCYRTVSTAALQVVAGRPPVDLKARALCAKWEIKNGRTPSIPVATEEEAEEWMIGEWQERWDRSTKGRHTHLLFPVIKDRLKLKHFQTDHYMSQLLTGHGDFAAKLHSFNLKASPLCDCGEPETVGHVALCCPQYIVERVQWLFENNAQTANMEVLRQAISTPAGLKTTQQFWKRIMKRKGWKPK